MKGPLNLLTPASCLLCLFFWVQGCTGARITSMMVPKWVQNGTEDQIILDCDYDLDLEQDKNLTLKWYFNDKSELIYEWIPRLDFRYVSGRLQGRFNWDFSIVSTPDTAYKKYRAIALKNPTIELSGRYICQVVSSSGDDSEEASMIIYAPPETIEFSSEPIRREKKILLSYRVEKVYPLPVITIYQGCLTPAPGLVTSSSISNRKSSDPQTAGDRSPNQPDVEEEPIEGEDSFEEESQSIAPKKVVIHESKSWSSDGSLLHRPSSLTTTTTSSSSSSPLLYPSSRRVKTSSSSRHSHPVGPSQSQSHSLHRKRRRLTSIHMNRVHPGKHEPAEPHVMDDDEVGRGGGVGGSDQEEPRDEDRNKGVNGIQVDNDVRMRGSRNQEDEPAENSVDDDDDDDVDPEWDPQQDEDGKDLNREGDDEAQEARIKMSTDRSSIYTLQHVQYLDYGDIIRNHKKSRCQRINGDYPVVFDLKLTIPGTDYMVKKSIQFFPNSYKWQDRKRGRPDVSGRRSRRMELPKTVKPDFRPELEPEGEDESENKPNGRKMMTPKGDKSRVKTRTRDRNLREEDNQVEEMDPFEGGNPTPEEDNSPGRKWILRPNRKLTKDIKGSSGKRGLPIHKPSERIEVDNDSSEEDEDEDPGRIDVEDAGESDIMDEDEEDGGRGSESMKEEDSFMNPEPAPSMGRSSLHSMDEPSVHTRPGRGPRSAPNSSHSSSLCPPFLMSYLMSYVQVTLLVVACTATLASGLRCLNHA